MAKRSESRQQAPGANKGQAPAKTVEPRLASPAQGAAPAGAAETAPRRMVSDARAIRLYLNEETRRQVAIAGKVKDARSGRFLEGARAEVSGPATGDRIRFTFTAADGIFYFMDLPDGTYKVRISVPGASSRYAAHEPNTGFPR